MNERPITDYKLVEVDFSSSDFVPRKEKHEALRRKVVEAISAGWEPFGNLVVAEYYIMQPMVMRGDSW